LFSVPIRLQVEDVIFVGESCWPHSPGGSSSLSVAHSLCMLQNVHLKCKVVWASFMLLVLTRRGEGWGGEDLRPLQGWLKEGGVS